MPIQKRKNIPDPTSTASFLEDEPDDARSPELQGQRLDVWQFINWNYHCTRDEVAKGLGLKSSTATARIKELIDLGYVVEPPGVKKLNSSGVMARVLQLSARKPGGAANDRVRVEVTLTIDCNGVYGATARVVNGLPQTGRATPILTKPMTLIAPPTASYAGEISTDTVAPVSRLSSQLNADEIIEAEYTIVKVE